MADAPQYRSRRWDSPGIAGRYQEFTDRAVLRGYAGVAYDALWNHCEQSFGTYAMSVPTPFYAPVRSTGRYLPGLMKRAFSFPDGERYITGAYPPVL